MIDVTKIIVRSGKGGNGSFSYRREKFVPKGGPDGGDGGDGGSVFLVGSEQKRTLLDYHGKATFKANDGQPGGKRQKSGQMGEDLLLPVPLGTIVWRVRTDNESERDSQNLGVSETESEVETEVKTEVAAARDNKELVGEIVAPGQKLLVARGGQGGRGNIHFKSSSNRTPMEYEEGGTSEEVTLLLELKLLADVGLVGLPNAGKSTLLSVLTKARPKIADYPFTTLEPNLGVMEIVAPSDKGKQSQEGDRLTRLVIADIPGLIEQASQGKGLGHEFLRHIERCKLLVYCLYVPEEHLIATNQAQAEILYRQYQLLRQELKEHNQELLERPYLIMVNKLDLLGENFASEFKKIWESLVEEDKTGLSQEAKVESAKEILLVSAATGQGLSEFKQVVWQKISQAPPSALSPVAADTDLTASSSTDRETSNLSDSQPDEKLAIYDLNPKLNPPTLKYRHPLKQ